MIVCVETESGNKKALLRFPVFTEVDNSNKKLVQGATIRSNSIKNILWIKGGKCAKVPFAEWKKDVEEGKIVLQ